MMDAAAASPTSIFLTDGSSGLALSLTRQLVAAGFQVSAAVEGLEQAHRLRDAGGIPTYPGLMRAGEIKSVLKAVEAQVVVHLATQKLNHVPFIHGRWSERASFVTDSTAAVVEASREAGIQFLVMLSYAYVYGDTHGEAVDEDTRPHTSAEAVIRAALQAEQTVLESGVPAAVLRAGYVYGAGSVETVRLRDDIIAGRSVVQGDAHAYANWVHMDDLASAVILAVQQQPAGLVLNIVDDHPASTVDFARYIAESVNVTPPGGAGFLGRWTTPRSQAALLEMSSRVSNRRARESLGWAPRYPSYREGIDQTLLVLRAEEPVM